MTPRPIAEVEFDPAREFHLWSYLVGHSQLLLRSNQQEGHRTRIEVLFKGVGLIQLPTAMTALSIRVAEPDDVGELPGGFEPHVEQRVYRLSFAGSSGIVAASSAFVSEDTLDYAAPSAFASSGLT